MEEGPVNLIAVNDDVVFAGDLNELFKVRSRDYGAGWVVGVAAPVSPSCSSEGVWGSYLMMMSLVLGLIKLFSSSMSNCHFFFSFAFHRLTSAPRDAGTAYSCW